VILLVAHGSPRKEGIKQTEAFKNAFSQSCNFPVFLCYLELVEPDIATGLKKAAAVAERGGKVVVLPLLLGAANHQKNDIPVAVQWARNEMPEISFDLASPFEPHGNLLTLLSLRIDEALKNEGSILPQEESAVLIVGRGSSDPQSNSEVARIAHLLYETNAYSYVSIAFQAVTRPSVNEAIERTIKCYKPSQLIIAPFLLFSGFVEERIKLIAAEATKDYSLPLIFSNPLGIHPLLVEIAKERVQECIEGKANMICDLCKYRMPFKGYEDQVGQKQFSHHFHP